MNRKLFYARYCAKLYGVFAKALAETDPHSKDYGRLFSDTLYYRTKRLTPPLTTNRKKVIS